MKQIICAWCEQEFGIKVKDPDASHGICKRHASESIKEIETMMRRAGLPDHIISKKIEDTRNRIESTTGAPDMVKDGIPNNSEKV